MLLKPETRTGPDWLGAWRLGLEGVWLCLGGCSFEADRRCCRSGSCKSLGDTVEGRLSEG